MTRYLLTLQIHQCCYMQSYRVSLIKSQLCKNFIVLKSLKVYDFVRKFVFFIMIFFEIRVQAKVSKKGKRDGSGQSPIFCGSLLTISILKKPETSFGGRTENYLREGLIFRLLKKCLEKKKQQPIKRRYLDNHTLSINSHIVSIKIGLESLKIPLKRLVIQQSTLRFFFLSFRR